MHTLRTDFLHGFCQMMALPHCPSKGGLGQRGVGRGSSPSALSPGSWKDKGQAGDLCRCRPHRPGVPEALCFPREKSMQTRDKRTRRHTVTFTYSVGILSLSFIAAILINKYDACSIFSRKSRRSGRLTHARVQSRLHGAWQTQSVLGTQAFQVYVSSPLPQPPIHQKYRLPQLYKVLSSKLVKMKRTKGTISVTYVHPVYNVPPSETGQWSRLSTTDKDSDVCRTCSRQRSVRFSKGRFSFMATVLADTLQDR